MVRALIETALACALIGSPAAAAAAGPGRSPRLTGRGEFGASYVHLHGDVGVIQDEEAHEFWTLGGAGSLDAAWGAMHVQADFAGEGNVDERSEHHADDTYRGSYGGGLHLNLRDPELGSIGAFGGLGSFGIIADGTSDPQTLSWTAGAEGQAYFDRVTLYLQAGYIDRQSVPSGGDIDALKNAGFGRVIGRYFPCDQLALTGEGSYTQGEMDPDGDNVWIVGWRAEVEWRPHGWPVSGFVSYTGAHYEQSDDNDLLNEHRIHFGVRYTFGQPSLLANDRHGASLELPRWLQLSGQTAGALE